MNKIKITYNSLLRRYYKYFRRRNSLRAANRNERRQQILTKHIERLYEKLVSLKISLQRGAVMSTVAIGATIGMPENAAAQSFIDVQTNPFSLTNVGGWDDSNPTFADLDGDGDLDMLSGGEGRYGDVPYTYDYGYFKYYENTGTATNPVFDNGEINPFSLQSTNNWYSAPTFVDLDGDGDFDMMSTDYYGNFLYYENTGTPTAPSFAAPVTNPFSLGYIGDYSRSKPAFADLDNDGDLDLMISHNNTSDIFYYENVGTNLLPDFGVQQINPFSLLPTAQKSSNLTLTDIDGDGDFDLLMGSGHYADGGNTFFFENIGDNTSPDFSPQQTNPFQLTTIGRWNAMTVGDLNGDGLLDILAGDRSGDFFFWEGCAPDLSSITVNSACAYVSPGGDYYWTTSGTYDQIYENVSGCDSIITVNLTIDPISDLPVNSNVFACEAGESATVGVPNAQHGVNYYLRDNENDTIVDGPIIGEGDGSTISFSTGPITSSMTYNIFAEKTVNSRGINIEDDAVSNANSKKIDCGSDASIQIGGTQITLEAWIYPTEWKNNPNEGQIINKEQNGFGSDFGYMIRCGGDGQLNFNIGDGAWNELTSPIGSLTLDTWQHVAASYDGATMKIFVNGVEVASQAETTTFSPGAENLFLGNYRNDGNAFLGKIDEVRIWSVSKTDVDIQGSMNNCLTGTETGLAAYYQFEDGMGSTTVTDVTGNGNTGTFLNMDANKAWGIGTPLCADCGDVEFTQLVTADINTTAIDNTVTASSTTLTANATGASYQWLDCDDNYSNISGETAQSFTATANGNYAVKVTVDGCSEISDCHAITTVGLEDIEFGSSINIYPNPTKDIINIDLGQNMSVIKMSLVSVDGKEIFVRDVNNQYLSIDLSSYPQGLYILNFSDGQNKSHHRIIKN